MNIQCNINFSKIEVINQLIIEKFTHFWHQPIENYHLLILWTYLYVMYKHVSNRDRTSSVVSFGSRRGKSFRTSWFPGYNHSNFVNKNLLKSNRIFKKTFVATSSKLSSSIEFNFRIHVYNLDQLSN